MLNSAKIKYFRVVNLRITSQYFPVDEVVEIKIDFSYNLTIKF
jgi:hypothetical protein